MTDRVYNFSPGPAVLPLPVLEQVQRDLLSLPGVGVSVLEIGHRTRWCDNLFQQTQANLRRLLAIPDNYSILFLQGGSRLQFAMVPMNLRAEGQSADYVLTGSWGKMACEEAQRLGKARPAFTSQATNFDRLPGPHQLELDPQAAYVHVTSNETIQGVQFLDEPAVGDAPLVCDASSDFLCRPLAIERYGLLYACAQKNAGPAGVTIVIIRDDLLARGSDRLPAMLQYKLLAREDSRLNTPNVFGVYVVNLVARWLLDEVGGLDTMLEINRRKARLLYDVLDAGGGFYQGHALPQHRSLMNVTFRLPDEATEKRFLAGAEARGLHYLKGHRSVGGIRASIYNAMPPEGVEALRDYMLEFQQSAGR